MSRRERRVSSVTLETFCHATEDVEKVERAILNLLPSDLRSSAEFEECRLEGHYGNPITILRAVLRGEEAERAVEELFSRMDEFDKKIVLESLERRLDSSSNLYLRFDKQRALLGSPRLLQGDDVIKVIVAFMPHIRRERAVIKALEGLGLKPGGER